MALRLLRPRNTREGPLQQNVLPGEPASAPDTAWSLAGMSVSGLFRTRGQDTTGWELGKLSL